MFCLQNIKQKKLLKMYISEEYNVRAIFYYIEIKWHPIMN